MSNRPVKIILEDMLDAITNIEAFTAGMDADAFKADIKTQAAVERCLEIIGEAANQLHQDFYPQHAQIQWHRVISLRNRIIHAYFDVNKDIVWNIVTLYLPGLKKDILGLLKNN